ncbi:hypothetical protein AX774_g2809 [Zancudomyces culisetae]|uniref:RING-type domain-containing protein n=1 Tax=Zancudomyces culisetae TaxID=1213189 RepID=A0A1R1PS11_ZANCU|nr:hypothetical protein AX774_g2809 [Zancudomyces culisetae]|eukprot:OMH83682.1 hypothetical protein AX774_g2809 [Zancudomyces culisetae]
MDRTLMEPLDSSHLLGQPNVDSQHGGLEVLIIESDEDEEQDQSTSTVKGVSPHSAHNSAHNSALFVDLCDNDQADCGPSSSRNVELGVNGSDAMALERGYLENWRSETEQTARPTSRNSRTNVENLLRGGTTISITEGDDSVSNRRRRLQERIQALNMDLIPFDLTQRYMTVTTNHSSRTGRPLRDRLRRRAAETRSSGIQTRSGSVGIPIDTNRDQSTNSSHRTTSTDLLDVDNYTLPDGWEPNSRMVREASNTSPAIANTRNRVGAGRRLTEGTENRNLDSTTSDNYQQPTIGGIVVEDVLSDDFPGLNSPEPEMIVGSVSRDELREFSDNGIYRIFNNFRPIFQGGLQYLDYVVHQIERRLNSANTIDGSEFDIDVTEHFDPSILFDIYDSEPTTNIRDNPIKKRRITQREARIASLGDYSRNVPLRNCSDFYESNEPSNSGESAELVMVCCGCDAPFLNTTDIMLSKCGHPICSPCFDGIGGSSTKCFCCGSRAKKSEYFKIFRS